MACPEGISFDMAASSFSPQLHPHGVSIAAPQDDADLDAIRSLFAEYADSLGFSLDYQDFASELAGLPGKFAAPSGALLLARVEGAPAGAVALRPLEPGIC